jgi:MFS family permease
MLGMFLAALDQTIVSTSIKTIGNDLHDLTAQAWVTTAFLITSTIAAPLFGKLSDIYGRKRLFMLAIVIFVAGSALCGLATSMYELAGFRAFQGIGAGGIMPLALAVIGDIIPPRERSRYQGYMMAVFASASVLGPLLGGLLSGAGDFLGVAGWRWIFYINVPIAAVALVVVAKVLKVDYVRRQRRIDWWGALMLAVGLVPLLVVAEQGQPQGWASAPRSLATSSPPPAWPCSSGSSTGWAMTRCCRCACSAAPPSPSPPPRSPSSAWPCSAGCRLSPCTCRSSRAPRRPSPACCCCRWSAG